MAHDFSEYDKYVMRHLLVNDTPDTRSEDEAAARIKPHEPKLPALAESEVEVEEMRLDGSPIDLIFTVSGEQVTAAIGGRRLYALWSGNEDTVPQVLSRRGWLAPHELQPGDVLLGPPQKQGDAIHEQLRKMYDTFCPAEFKWSAADSDYFARRAREAAEGIASPSHTHVPAPPEPRQPSVASPQPGAPVDAREPLDVDTWKWLAISMGIAALGLLLAYLEK